MTHRKQLTVFGILLVVYALSVLISYAFLSEQLTAGMATQSIPAQTLAQPAWLYGVLNAVIFLLLYGLFGLLGYVLARKVGLPGIFSPDGGWRRWVVIPVMLGILCALFLIATDLAFAPVNGIGRLPHPPFPLSFLASLSAGIGEEILFRGFVFGFWSLILTWLLKRLNGRTAALWIANIIAALAFGAGHLASLAMVANAVATDAAGNMTFLFDQINPALIVEAFLLNGVIGLIAGWRYMRDGFVAAAGVHFWTDIFWHVLWGLIPA